METATVGETLQLQTLFAEAKKPFSKTMVVENERDGEGKADYTAQGILGLICTT